MILLRDVIPFGTVVAVKNIRYALPSSPGLSVLLVLSNNTHMPYMVCLCEDRQAREGEYSYVYKEPLSFEQIDAAVATYHKVAKNTKLLYS